MLNYAAGAERVAARLNLMSQKRTQETDCRPMRRFEHAELLLQPLWSLGRLLRRALADDAAATALELFEFMTIVFGELDLPTKVQLQSSPNRLADSFLHALAIFCMH